MDIERAKRHQKITTAIDKMREERQRREVESADGPWFNANKFPPQVGTEVIGKLLSGTVVRVKVSKVDGRTRYTSQTHDYLNVIEWKYPRETFDALVADAKAEAHRAMIKFPQPNYVLTKIAEEAGEVIKAGVHCAEGREPIEEVRAEMTQCIAMLYRLWIEGDEVHGLPPVGENRRRKDD